MSGREEGVGCAYQVSGTAPSSTIVRSAARLVVPVVPVVRSSASAKLRKKEEKNPHFTRLYPQDGGG